MTLESAPLEKKSTANREAVTMILPQNACLLLDKVVRRIRGQKDVSPYFAVKQARLSQRKK